MEYKDAFSYTMKLVVIMSQLGLIKSENGDKYPQENQPDWQKSFYSIDSNSEMNLFFASKLIKLMGTNLTRRLLPK